MPPPRFNDEDGGAYVAGMERDRAGARLMMLVLYVFGGMLIVAGSATLAVARRR